MISVNVRSCFLSRDYTVINESFSPFLCPRWCPKLWLFQNVSVQRSTVAALRTVPAHFWHPRSRFLRDRSAASRGRSPSTTWETIDTGVTFCTPQLSQRTALWCFRHAVVLPHYQKHSLVVLLFYKSRVCANMNSAVILCSSVVWRPQENNLLPCLCGWSPYFFK